MKCLLTALLLLTPGAGLMAQSASTQPGTNPLKKEAGIFVQGESYGLNSSLSLIGVQYKHWHTEHLGIRFIGAFAQHLSSHSQVQYAANDTSYSRDEQLQVNLPVVGVGLEAQRHFYRRIYLFAALEVKGGYGRGSADTIISISSRGGSPTFERYGSQDASLLYMGLSASVGARVQLSRLSFGLEIIPMRANYTQTNYKGNNNGLFDFSLGSYSQRLSVQYRF